MSDGKKRISTTVTVAPETIEKVRDVAYWERESVSGFIEAALLERVDRMEKERGEPYPRRKGELRPGRPTN